MAPGPDEIAYWLEIAEARAWADMYRMVGQTATDPLGAQVENDGDAVWFMLTSLNIGYFNRSIGLGVDAPATESIVDGMLGSYRAAGQTSFTIQVSPFARPSALESWLEARGMRRGGRWAKLWRDTAAPPTERTDLRIERVGPAHAENWSSVILEAFELPEQLGPFAAATIGQPDWYHYLAFDGDIAVGAGGLFVTGDVGWLGFGSTLESHRGRGAQSAIFARRIRDAADRGVKLLITETGEELPDRPNPSYRNMLRAGFRLAYPRQNWLEPETPGGEG